MVKLGCLYLKHWGLPQTLVHSGTRIIAILVVQALKFHFTFVEFAVKQRFGRTQSERLFFGEQFFPEGNFNMPNKKQLANWHHSGIAFYVLYSFCIGEKTLDLGNLGRCRRSPWKLICFVGEVTFMS